VTQPDPARPMDGPDPRPTLDLISDVSQPKSQNVCMSSVTVIVRKVRYHLLYVHIFVQVLAAIYTAHGVITVFQLQLHTQ